MIIGHSILDGKIHKDSDAGIGWFAVFYDKIDVIYGKFVCGIYVGRWLISLDFKEGLRFYRGNATGCGG